MLFLLGFIAAVLKSIFPLALRDCHSDNIREDSPVNSFMCLVFLGKCNMAAAMETEQLGVEIFETAECEENIEPQDQPKLEPFYVERYSWSQLKKLLADTRKYHGYMMAKAPHDFMFVKRNDPDGPHSDRIYYLGEYEGSYSFERKHFCKSNLKARCNLHSNFGDESIVTYFFPLKGKILI